MILDKFQDSLIWIAEKLNNQNIGWGLTGSCNLAFQGIDISWVNDIDIIVLGSDFKKAEIIFKDNLVYPAKNKTMNEGIKLSYETFKFKINNIEVEIIKEGDLRNNYLSKKEDKLIKKKLDKTMIFCYPLKVELAAYQKLSRFNKAEKIKQFLNNKK